MRARTYSINGTRAVANPTATLLGISSASTIRPNVYDGWVGSSATPADNALQWFIQRFTAPGTNTSVTPQGTDPADPASLATCGKNHTVEPTYTAGAILWEAALNQRATHRMQLDPAAPLIMPATANNGVGLYPVHSSFTGTVDGCLMFAE